MADLFEDYPDDSFDRFWARYPRKQGKGAARRAWAKLDASQRRQAIEDDTQTRYAQRDYRLIPHPSTYLNQERWEDELDPVSHNTRHRSLQDDLTDHSWADETIH